MNGDMISMEFDYGDLPAEKVLECETAFQTACAVEEQATRMIGEQFAKVKNNLKDLRNGEGWRGWCEKRLGFSHTQAQNYINEYENGGLVKNLYKFGKSSRFLLTAPTMPQEVRDRADALAEAGEDVSVKTIKQLKADYEAERQARELFERRAQESQAESNERRLKIRELTEQIDLLKAQPAPEPVIVEKAPDDYEDFKRKAVEFQQQTDALQTQLADLQKQQARLVNDQVKAKLQEREAELNAMEQRKDFMEKEVERMKAYMASLESENKRLEVHQSVINGSRLELISLAAFLNDLDPINDPATVRKWLALADMHEEAMNAIRLIFGQPHLALAA